MPMPTSHHQQVNAARRTYVRSGEEIPSPREPDGHGQADLANQQAANLALSTSYMQVSPEGAADYAAMGIVVLAVQPTQTGHGHIATVSPESVGPVTANGRPQKIQFNQIGKSTVKDAELKDTFTTSSEVTYYVQRGP